MPKAKIWDANTSSWVELDAKDADTVDGYHAGNASGNIPVSNGTVCTNLNADLLDGAQPNTNGTANTIAKRDGAGDLEVRLLRPTYTITTTTPNYIVVQHALGDGVDNYARPCTLAQLRASLGGAGSGLDADKVDNIHFRVLNGVLQYDDGSGWNDVGTNFKSMTPYILTGSSTIYKAWVTLVSVTGSGLLTGVTQGGYFDSRIRITLDGVQIFEGQLTSTIEISGAIQVGHGSLMHKFNQSVLVEGYVVSSTEWVTAVVSYLLD